jgi:DNA polymerase
MPRGTVLHAGRGKSVVLPDMDFETYSDAGFAWNEALQKWESPPGAPSQKRGLPVIGVAAYAEHPSTEVLSFAYDLKDGHGRRFWMPGLPNPQDLFDYLAAGGIVEAHNIGFEWWIWTKVCTAKYGWPALPSAQVRCSAAKSRAYALPGALAKVGAVLQLAQQKDADGDRLLKKFSMPRNPTAKDKRRRIRPTEDAVDGPRLYAYNMQDIVTEAHVSARVPDLQGEELEFWLMDQRINRRGVQMDVAGVHACCAVVDQALEQYNRELYELTGGAVARASEIAKMQAWLCTLGVGMSSLDEEAVDEKLAEDDKSRRLPPLARRALEIRQLVGSAAVKKVYAMRLQMTSAGRLHELFTFYGARTGRTTGNGPQPTNLPNSGPKVMRCGCGRHYGVHLTSCPWCAFPAPPSRKPIEWDEHAVEDALLVISSRDLRTVEHFFGSALAAVSGCLRGLFCAAPGHDLVVSDYSAIEAVVLAMIAGEQWRIDVFRTHGKIYEQSAAKISGVPFEDFMRHAGYTDAELAAPDWYTRKPAAPGSHHPLRKTIGKVAELASGYQGWIGSWKAFGADEFMTELEMKDAILAWRAASPAIVEFWGGQSRRSYGRDTPELFGVEGMFIAALRSPGTQFEFRGFKFLYQHDILHLTLLSGRSLHYHRPQLRPSDKRQGEHAISYEGWNTNPKNGPVGWIRMDTWGGRLTENIVQATARDIQWYGMLNLERAGYPIVLHVYDEDVAEVPEGFGSVQEFERIMGAMPPWAQGWPIKASGGFRSKRYRK